MKRISTRIFSILAVLLSFAFSVSAEEYKSMIRYDRVWECRSFDITYGSNDGVNKCMKFDGTVEINGKTYHRLVTFRKAYPMCDSNGDIISFKMEDCHENEGYMREEDGKVYTLFVSEGASDGDLLFGKLYLSDPENAMDQSDCREGMLYDFTLDEGDTYTAMSFLKRTATLETFKVINVSSVEISGENLKLMKVGWLPHGEYSEDYADYSVVEGVGAVEYGCLNHYEFSDRLTTIWFWNSFVRLFDMEGNFLYGCCDCWDGLDWGSFVSEVEEVKRPEESDAPLYDILGRRIAEAIPGQLYIQGGKKYIAK